MFQGAAEGTERSWKDAKDSTASPAQAPVCSCVRRSWAALEGYRYGTAPLRRGWDLEFGWDGLLGSKQTSREPSMPHHDRAPFTHPWSSYNPIHERAPYAAPLGRHATNDEQSRAPYGMVRYLAVYILRKLMPYHATLQGVRRWKPCGCVDRTSAAAWVSMQAIRSQQSAKSTGAGAKNARIAPECAPIAPRGPSQISTINAPNANALWRYAPNMPPLGMATTTRALRPPTSMYSTSTTRPPLAGATRQGPSSFRLRLCRPSFGKGRMVWVCMVL